MGNWGNTLDRWYHRGAVVMWQRSRAFAVQAEAISALGAGRADGPREDGRPGRGPGGGRHPGARSGTGPPHAWRRRASSPRRCARRALLDEPALAAMLLRPFRLELLTTSHAKALSALVGSYGEPWAAELMAAWAAKRRSHHPEGASPEAWMASLPPLCLALRESRRRRYCRGPVVAARVLELAQPRDRSRPRARYAEPARADAGPQLGRPVGAMLEGASLVDATDLRDEAVGVLCRDDDLLACAIAALRVDSRPAMERGRPRRRRDPLLRGPGSPPRPPLAGRATTGRSSFPKDVTASCAVSCVRFLVDPTQTTLEWPLAKERRRHVHRPDRHRRTPGASPDPTGRATVHPGADARPTRSSNAKRSSGAETRKTSPGSNATVPIAPPAAQAQNRRAGASAGAFQLGRRGTRSIDEDTRHLSLCGLRVPWPWAKCSERACARAYGGIQAADESPCARSAHTPPRLGFSISGEHRPASSGRILLT